MNSFSNALFISLFSLLFINACATGQNHPMIGASWVAQQDIIFAERSTIAFIQGGRLLERSNQRSRNAPYCEIQSNRQFDQPLTIAKGSRLKVLRVNHSTNSVLEVQMIFETRMQVESDAYPMVRAVSCFHWASQSDRHLSSEVIENTLRGVLRLEQK